MAKHLHLADFYGADFDVDEFVVHAIGPRLGHMVESDAAVFDPETVLEALIATKGEVDKLRDDVDSRVRAALDRVETLSDRHTRGVKELRNDADQVLHTVQDLQRTVGSMGAKAVTMGRHLDKIDQERRRACDAAQAIRIYEVLCSEDEDAAARAIKALIPEKLDMRRNAARANDGKTSALLDSALMLRKLQAAAFVATGEGAKRARVRLEEAGRSLEHAAVLCFDEASACCESAMQDGGSGALLDMRAAVDALLYYNGGATIMHRYVSTRKPFLDPDIITGDRQAVEQVASYSDAVAVVERLVDDMLAFLHAETQLLPHIFANVEGVKLLLLHRLCYERLAPTLDGLMERLHELQDAATDHTQEGGVVHTHLASSNRRLDATVKILQTCALFLARLEAGVGLSGNPESNVAVLHLPRATSHDLTRNVAGPLADKDAREEISDILDDMMAPYVNEFVPQQMEVLGAHLGSYFPTVTPAHTVEYRLDMAVPADVDTPEASSMRLRMFEEDERGQGAADGADHGRGDEAASCSDCDGEDGDQVPPAHSSLSPADVQEGSNRCVDGDPASGKSARVGTARGRGALAWAARKGQQLSSNLHLPRRRGKSRPLGSWVGPITRE